MQATCPRCSKPLPPLPGATPAQLQTVVAELEAQRLINAIKLVRELSHAGLKEAKDYVDCPHRPIAGAPAAAPAAVAPGAKAAPFQGKAWGCYELRQLPEEIQRKLVDLSQGWSEPGYASLRTESLGGALFFLVLGLGLIGVGIGFFTNYHSMPTPDLIWKCLPLIIAGVALDLGALAMTRRVKGSRMKPGFAVTPAILARTTGGDVVELYRLAALDGMKPLGGWASELRFGDRVVRVQGGDTGDLRAVVEAATRLYKANALPSGSVAKEHDWLARVEEERETRMPGSGRILRLVVAIPIAVALLVGAWAARYVQQEHHRYSYATERNASSWALDDYRWFANAVEQDVPSFLLPLAPLAAHKAEVEKLYDERKWKEKSEKGATGLREYMKELPRGSHLTDAKQALATLYADAEARYVAHAKNAESKAVAGMKALVARLRESDDPAVGIVYLPAEGLDGAGPEEKVKKMTGSSKVTPVGPAFTKERNERRQDRITAEFRYALKQVFPDDLFLLESKDKPGARFVVRHTVRGSGDWYTRKQEDKLPLAEREVFVGIDVAFEVVLEVGDEKFPVAILASPAPNFSVRSTSSVYDVMAETAFDEFGKKLIKAYGVEK